ncbi:hypothetical protein FACS1894110_04480 [Spirochaetia bacterium]|nr:hypothetical protein FACS1894110_04480 [Spirochaetia bacterium]
MSNRTKLIISFLLIILLIGCSKKSYEYSPAAGSIASESVRERAADNIEPTGENTQSFQETETRKLITDSNLQIRIDNLDNGIDKLDELMKKHNTYASSRNIYENSRNYILKVPEKNYALFLKEVMDIGKIINYSETTEDVTIKYYDLESRLNTKKELIKTYQSYLSKAKNIEEILSVESRITELQKEIDDVGKQFRILNNLIDYSTIRLELLGPISVTNYGKETLGEKIKELMTGFGDYASTILLILLAIIIYGIPAIVILLLLYLVLFGRIGLLRKVYKFVSKK